MESSLNQIILNQIIRTLIIDNETQQITYIIDQHLQHLRHLNRIQAPQWILDALICNGGGIYLSMKAREYLKMKPYNWRGMWTIPTVRGKMMRVFWSIYAS
ncbi:unnamed protein product [Rotaria socialis]|uniref:Phosphatidylserine synthase n=1 Tax=Rotaria socialis TaxID=392032 RepID=A0A820WB06_9BILA|nr:unnamed protein product [Rotaria socialis]